VGDLAWGAIATWLKSVINASWWFAIKNRDLAWVPAARSA
jgi:hypothetical protein